MKYKWKEKFCELLLNRSIGGGDICLVEAQSIKYQEMPNKLFKYCNFTCYNKQNLVNDIVWLANADSFNDPYDSSHTYFCKALLNRKIAENGLEFFFGNIDLGKFTFSKNEKEEVSNAPDKIKNIIEIMALKETELNDDGKKKIINAFLYSIEESSRPSIKISRSKAFASCFSETNKSIIMWSHYAYKHKGFCIEYDVKEDDNSWPFFYPVFYEKNLFDLTKYLLPSEGEFNEFSLLIAFLTKSKDWEYEKEWRSMPFPFLDKESKWHMPKPTALYVGAKANDYDKQWLKKIAQDRNIDFYQEKINEKIFQIYFEKDT